MKRLSLIVEHSARRRYSVLIAGCLATLISAPASVGAQEITLIAGADVQWSHHPPTPGNLANPAVIYHPEASQNGDGERIPFTNRPETHEYLTNLGRIVETPRSHWVVSQPYDLNHLTSAIDTLRYPFERVRPVFLEANIAFLNLEMPLSESARKPGRFRGSPMFAEAMRWAGVDIVSTANNHSVDAEGVGLLETVEALARAGVGSVGTGVNLAAARRPHIIERDGIRVAFLGYTSHAGFEFDETIWALPGRSGAVPMDPLLIEEDIARVRDDVDYVIVSSHWDPLPVRSGGEVQDSPEDLRDLPHPDARDFAKRILDAGADVFLGHGPHVPLGMEAYGGKLIVYGQGNFIFGHSHDYWGDNYLVRLRMIPDRILQVEVLPIAGKGPELSQPFVLDGARAQRLLEIVQRQSQQMGTALVIEGDVGVIQLSGHTDGPS